MSKPRDTLNTQKKRAQRLGRWAELLARGVLMARGHRILAANYRTSVGEIDLITLKQNIIGFVEVKARPSEAQALEAIRKTQQARIQRAAEHFLAHKPEWQSCDVRFDVALVTGPMSVRILYDAWRP